MEKAFNFTVHFHPKRATRSFCIYHNKNWVLRVNGNAITHEPLKQRLANLISAKYTVGDKTIMSQYLKCCYLN